MSIAPLRRAVRVRVVLVAMVVAAVGVLAPAHGDHDVADPDVGVTVPGAGAVLVPDPGVVATGLASDDVGVVRAAVAIRDASTGQWWQGGTQWAARFVWVDAALTDPGAPSTGWAVAWVPPAAGAYGLTAQAWDAEGKVDPTRPWVPFTIAASVPPDTTPPDATVAAPAPNAEVPGPAVTVSGGASDDRAVAGVDVAIRDRVSGQWLREGGWGTFAWHAATVDAPGGTSTTWALSVDLPTGEYGALVRAVDDAGNVDPSAAWVPFTVAAGGPVDVAPPSVTVDTPAAGATVPAGAVAVAGSATDDVAVQRVEVSVRNTTTGLWLRSDGTWGAWQGHDAALSAPGSSATGWTWGFTPPQDGTYGVLARATDGVGNVGPQTFVTFAVSGGGGGGGGTPPGGYGIGTTTLALFDATRGRSLPTTVQYPTTGASGTDVPAAPGAFPVVLAGHGGAGTGASAAQLHRYLTRAGYVVVAPTFPAGNNYTLLAGDVSFVLTEVLARSTQPGLLNGLLDGQNVGWIGTSKGGFIGFGLYLDCCIDPRIDAVVTKIAVATPGIYDWARGPALLMINGTEDPTAPYPAALDTYAQAVRPKGLITLEGIGHDLNVGSSSILQDSTLGFFDRFLRGDAGGLARVTAAVDAAAFASLMSDW